MTFKMSKDESEILTLAFKLRDVVRGSDPDVVSAAINVFITLNNFDHDKDPLPVPKNFATDLAKGFEEAALQFGARMGIPPPEFLENNAPPPKPVGPLSPEEIKALHDEDEPDAKQ